MQTITVKIKLVIFGLVSDELSVFMNKNQLPAAEITQMSNLGKQVEELFLEVIGSDIGNSYTEQLYTTALDDEINIVYYVLLETHNNANNFVPIKQIYKNVHEKEIVSYAVQRLQWKVEYTNVVYSLLPKEFTLSELQKAYEAILEQTLDKRNFRKKILGLNFLTPTGKRRVGVSRPAQMYTFKKRKPAFVKIFS